MFTQSGTSRLLPTPVVIRNYQSDSSTTPNMNGSLKLNGTKTSINVIVSDDESTWVYHRRFFLIDRISGITQNNGLLSTKSSFYYLHRSLFLELRNIHYAKSIRILNTLTSDTNYILPPVIVIEYGELTVSDLGKNAVVQVRVSTFTFSNDVLIFMLLDYIRN